MALPIEPAKNPFSVLLFFGLVLAAAGARAAEVTLAWDANGESDLEGYGVYYQAGTEGPLYDFFGYVDLSDLADEGSPTFTVTGLRPGTRYHFAISAYDAAGIESALSASVCADVGAVVTPCAITGGSAGATPSAGSSAAPAAQAASSGGGGGGCFIQALTRAEGCVPGSRRCHPCSTGRAVRHAAGSVSSRPSAGMRPVEIHPSDEVHAVRSAAGPPDRSCTCIGTSRGAAGVHVQWAR